MVSAIGLTSASVASSSANMHQRRSATSAAPAAASAGIRPAAMISAALTASTPVSGDTGMRATASGLVCATSSISMPPCTVQMERKVRLARSSRNDR